VQDNVHRIDGALQHRRKADGKTIMLQQGTGFAGFVPTQLSQWSVDATGKPIFQIELRLAMAN
jgi:hypothetical protein